ncbi:hypothetical protein MLD52_18880 [Puniceicoccaceae bacterium K14]|nr:hypothetical protein [Puniceicoccaceae bacterium K14]
MKFTFLYADNSEKILNWTPDSFLEGVKSLPLAEELERADELEECSPTISIIKAEKTDILWGSIVSDKGSDICFVIGLIDGEKEYGLGNASLSEYIEIALAYIDNQDVRVLLRERVPVKKRGFIAQLFGW